jgi:hypothetical protein
MTARSQTEQLVAEFQARSLPKAGWTHQAHLRVGLWHVLHFSPDEALLRLRSGIVALNAAHGTANTNHGGYHESITRFYVEWISEFVAHVDRNRPIDDLANDLILAAGDSKLPLRHYSAARLFSVQARRGWVEPDLRPLTCSRK